MQIEIRVFLKNQNKIKFIRNYDVNLDQMPSDLSEFLNSLHNELGYIIFDPFIILSFTSLSTNFTFVPKLKINYDFEQSEKVLFEDMRSELNQSFYKKPVTKNAHKKEINVVTSFSIPDASSENLYSFEFKSPDFQGLNLSPKELKLVQQLINKGFNEMDLFEEIKQTLKISHSRRTLEKALKEMLEA